MEIQILKKEDLQKCAVLFYDVYSKSPWNEQWNSIEQIKKYLKELIKNPLFEGYIVWENEILLAVCMGHTKTWIEGTELIIDEFFVDSSQQRKKIGSYFMNYIKEEAKKKNYYCIGLSTMRSFPAQSFYEKHGFELKNEVIFMTSYI